LQAVFVFQAGLFTCKNDDFNFTSNEFKV